MVKVLFIILEMSRLTINNTSQDVFNKTNNGLAVFQNEISDFSLVNKIRDPFGDTIDKNPSCMIKQSSSGLYLLNVYNGEGGFYNCIQFIQKKYSISYIEAIDYIINDRTLQSVQTAEIVEKDPLYYDFTKQPYTKEHLDYYCIGGLTEKFLTDEMDIYAIKYYNINHSVKAPKKNTFMFAYAYRNIIGEYKQGQLKLLTLGDVDKKDKWRNNLLPYNFFYTHKIKDNTTVFVSKSNKDACITQLLGITSIAAMSENQNNIITGLEKLIKLFPTVKFIISLGTDEQAVNTRIAICKELNLDYFEIPQYLECEGINDNFEYVKNIGIERFKRLLKNKKYL